MIIIDTETSGLYPEKHGIWQIGALEFQNPENTFLEESKIDDEDKVEPEALKVTGKTEYYLRDSKKQTQKQLIENFFNWAAKIKSKILIAHNASFDLGFLNFKSRKYNLEFPFKHRSLDLHSIAQTFYYKNNGNFLIKEENNEITSDMSLSNIMKICGMKDERIRLKDGKVVQKGNPHNALEDARIEAECLRRLLAK